MRRAIRARQPDPAPYLAGARRSTPLPRLGPAQGNPVTAVGPVAMKPAATLACPIVSALDRWLADTVQPAAMRWFGARVVEIKQISAYSCRGMNGNPHAHISEHAFGNALDIAAFMLADGRRITVKDGWRGMPEEQGFLRDVQARRVRAFHHRAGAGLERLSLRSHPRRSDAPRQPPPDLPAGRGLRRRGRRARAAAQSLCERARSLRDRLARRAQEQAREATRKTSTRTIQMPADIVRYLTHPQVQIDPAVPVPQWGLSPVGRARTEALANASWLASTTQIVSSGERKAIETAEIIADSSAS